MLPDQDEPAAEPHSGIYLVSRAKRRPSPQGPQQIYKNL